jgi:indole-3-glycerol phosphate synthase
MTASYLEQILEATKERVYQLRRRKVSELEREALAQEKSRDFMGALQAPQISLVAEIKRRSPSAGNIAPDADPAKLAVAYRDGGARALSVLTEPRFFSGSKQDLKLARDASGLPVLRKDFLIHHYQVLESRAESADAVLLIVAVLKDRHLLTDLIAATEELGMAALVEIHDEWEIDSALEAGAKLVGINQRDLRTFEVDKRLAARLRRRVPPGVPVLAESGIASRTDVEALEAAGVEAVLVGEALMRSEDPERAVEELLGKSPPK